MGALRIDDYEPHVLRTIVDALVSSGTQFMFTVVGSKDERLKMGFPEYVTDEPRILIQPDPAFHHMMDIVTDDERLAISLGFDSLRRVVIPWNMIEQLVVIHNVARTMPDMAVTIDERIENVKHKLTVIQGGKTDCVQPIARSIKDAIISKNDNVITVRFGDEDNN